MHNKKNNTNKSHNFIQGLRPLSNALPHGLKKIIKKSGYNLSNVVDNWSKIVGKNISNSCYPNSIKIGKQLSNGILVINVIHGKELDIEYKDNELTVEGKKKEEDETDYVHKGIANRSFKKVWHIEDHTEVVGAQLEHGLLKVSLEKIVPEELKPKKIKINKKQERRSSKELLQEGAS